MKITYNAVLNYHPIFIAINQLIEELLTFKFDDRKYLSATEFFAAV